MAHLSITRVSNWQQVAKALNYVTAYRTMVGVPAQEALRKPQEGEEPFINNAFLAYIHENGAPEANVPARPFLRPAIREMRAEIIQRMLAMTKLAATGDIRAIERGFQILGIRATLAVKRKLNEGIPPPLAESTLQARARRGRKGAKAELKRRAAGGDPGMDLAKPLIDTGQLRNSITYVVRRMRILPGAPWV